MDRSPVFGGPPAPRAAERVLKLPPTGSGMTTSQGEWALVFCFEFQEVAVLAPCFFGKVYLLERITA